MKFRFWKIWHFKTATVSPLSGCWNICYARWNEENKSESRRGAAKKPKWWGESEENKSAKWHPLKNVSLLENDGTVSVTEHPSPSHRLSFCMCSPNEWLTDFSIIYFPACQFICLPTSSEWVQLKLWEQPCLQEVLMFLLFNNELHSKELDSTREAPVGCIKSGIYVIIP